MSKTLTSSLQMLKQLKNQYENVNEPTYKDGQPAEVKNYGSIRRANPTSNTVSRNSVTGATQNYKDTFTREQKTVDDYKLKAKFESDFENLEQEIYEIMERAKNFHRT